MSCAQLFQLSEVGLSPNLQFATEGGPLALGAGSEVSQWGRTTLSRVAQGSVEGRRLRDRGRQMQLEQTGLQRRKDSPLYDSHTSLGPGPLPTTLQDGKRPAGSPEFIAREARGDRRALGI